MVTYLVRTKINRRILQIIHQDKDRNHWTPEKLAMTTGLALDQVKQIKTAPATVPCRDLYRLFENGLDSTSLKELHYATMELQLSTAIVRNKLFWLVKIERGVTAYLKKYGLFALGIILVRLLWDITLFLIRGK